MKVPRFTDNQGRVWPVEITVQTVKDLRRSLDVDLYSVIEPESGLLQRMATDAVLLCDVLYVVCRRDCGVSDEDFGRALDGPVIEQAALSLLEAIEHFFQNPRQAATTKFLTGNLRLARSLGQLIARAWNDGYLRPAVSSESILQNTA